MFRIPCPYCGVRDQDEYTAWGDANREVPELDADQAVWVNYVYQRDNPRGVTREFYQHTLGCRRWLVVTRNNLTHEIVSSIPAYKLARAPEESL